MNNIVNGLLMELNNIGKVFFNYAAGIFIQTAILVTVLFIIDLLLRKRIRAVIRYCVWLLVLVKLILPPTLSLPTGIAYWAPNRAPAQVPTSEHPASVVGFEQVNRETFPSSQSSDMLAPVNPVESNSVIEPYTVSLIPITWQAIIFVLWLFGVLAFLLILIQRLKFVRGLVSRSKPASDDILTLLQECCLEMNVRQKIQLRLSEAVSSPAVCGLINPVILIPVNLVNNLSREGLRSTLIHELAHIKRLDLWINFVQTILQVIYFYNPFVWFANSAIRKVCEEAVDETVLVALGGQIDDYSNTLIDIGEKVLWKSDLGLRLIGVAESKKALQWRIKHMLNRPIPKNAKIGILGFIVILIVAAVLLPMSKAERSNQQVTSGAGEMAPAMTEGDVIVDPNTGVKYVLTKTFSGVSNVIGHVNKLILSPDARFLLFWGRVLPLDGTETFRYTELSGDVREVAVSPNGQYIVHGQNAVWLQSVSPETLRPDGPAKKLLDLEGGRLVGAGNRQSSLFWTQDSQTVFFWTYGADGEQHSYAFSAATGDPVSFPDATSRGLLSPDGTCVASPNASLGFQVKPIGDEALRQLSEVPAIQVCWSNDGQWLIGTEFLGAVQFVSYPEGMEYHVPLPKELEEDWSTLCVGPSADRSKLFFFQAGYNLTYGLKVASAEGTDLKHMGYAFPRDIRWAQDGTALFQPQSGEYNLVMNPISGDEPVEFSLKPAIPDGANLLSLAPNGKYLLYTLAHESDSSTLDLSVLPLSLTDHEAVGPAKVLFHITYPSQGSLPRTAWSPDSTRVAFTGKTDSVNEEDIWNFFTDSRAPIRLTQTTAIESDLKWSPDGSMLAFICDDVDTVELKVIPTIGGEAVVIRKWTDANMPVLGWGWSPDSKSLTIVEDSMLVQQPLSGDNGETIANLREYGIENVKWLDWSPDGSRLAMACPRRNTEGPLDSWGQLLFLRIEGGHLQRTGATDIGPATWTGSHIWSPDSTRVAYRDEGLVAVRPEGRLYEVAVDDILERINAEAIPPLQSLLHLACQNGNKDSVDLLIENGADVNAKNYNGQTSLHLACEIGHNEIAELLIDNGANLNAKNYNGQTSLHVACGYSHKEVAELLIENGADINAKNTYGGTPLNVASQRENKDIVELLIDRGADINNKNNNGMNPLHQASGNGLKDIVELLISKGADLNIKNNAGLTPIDLAKQKDYTEIVELLREH